MAIAPGGWRVGAYFPLQVGQKLSRRTSGARGVDRNMLPLSSGWSINRKTARRAGRASVSGFFRLHAGSRNHFASGGWPGSIAHFGVVDQSIVEIIRPGAGDPA
jgi:hypothetical protein